MLSTSYANTRNSGKLFEEPNRLGMAAEGTLSAVKPMARGSYLYCEVSNASGVMAGVVMWRRDPVHENLAFGVCSGDRVNGITVRKKCSLKEHRTHHPP